MDDEPGAFPRDRPVALRAAKEARPRSCGHIRDDRAVEQPPRRSGCQRPGPRAERRPAGVDERRATGDRNRIFLRADVQGSGRKVQSAARDREDTNPFRLGEAQAGTRRSREDMSCDLELVYLYAVHALPPSEIPLVKRHPATCAVSPTELRSVPPVIA